MTNDQCACEAPVVERLVAELLKLDRITSDLTPDEYERQLRATYIEAFLRVPPWRARFSPYWLTPLIRSAK